MSDVAKNWMAARPRGRTDLFYQEVPEGGVLFDPGVDKVYVLNLSAAFIWSFCDGEHSGAEIVDELAASLGSGGPARGALEGDVCASLDHFRRNGLLVDA